MIDDGARLVRNSDECMRAYPVSVCHPRCSPSSEPDNQRDVFNTFSEFCLNSRETYICRATYMNMNFNSREKTRERVRKCVVLALTPRYCFLILLFSGYRLENARRVFRIVKKRAPPRRGLTPRVNRGRVHVRAFN